MLDNPTREQSAVDGPSLKFQHLIVRLEKATEPDRELDLDIFKEVLPVSFIIATRWRWRSRAVHIRCTPEFTGWIDVAADLVPDGCDYMIQTPSKYAQVWKGGAPYFEGNGSTLAIALCIAALKARSSQGAPHVQA